MQITELENQIVKLSDNSITCKREDGKTAGIVRGAVRFTAASPRVAQTYFKTVRPAWNSGKAKNIYIYENSLYYFNNAKTEKLYHDPRFIELYRDEISRHNTLITELRAAGITVITCYC